MRCHYTPTRMDKIWNTHNIKFGEHVEQEKLSVTAGGNAKPLWKTLGQFITKLNLSLPYDPAIVLLGIYPNDRKLMYTQKPEHECL